MNEAAQLEKQNMKKISILDFTLKKLSVFFQTADMIAMNS
jgi:hypothetical protein